MKKRIFSIFLAAITVLAVIPLSRVIAFAADEPTTVTSIEIEAIKPADGIFLQYAPFNRDHDKPLDDPDSQRNRQERLHLVQLLAYFGKENAQVLDYWLDNSLFSGWQKPPKEFHLRKNVLRRDLRFYRDLGFRHIMTFACYLGQDYRQLHGDTPDILDYGKALEQP
jgi:hypothetical protein